MSSREEQREFTPRTGWSGVWTLPNAISVARIACIPWFVWLLLGTEDRTAAALLLGALGATDWVDGWIARRFDQISDIGKVLDPTADRLLLVVAAPAMIIDGSVPTWFAAAALLREVLIGVAALLLAGFGARRIDVTWWGKTGTFALLFAFPCFLAGESTITGRPFFAVAAWIFAIPGLLIAWWAGLGYVPEGLRALREGRAAREGA
ncbi:MAG: CDP-alcohol phosphatidyltransferase family protein [Acidimicrobiales bacterium]|nr:CDP-alcohol phosphatidyltransferase family protein [Acidimicrobiales bacterium]MDP6650411.1 CDP-alcohol phosphatidyltransferase family protein [Acidimicrobiales bacterium]MDP6759911.1 CDP-alcohol phosphatidyltransferase family protein [Acidimicrobiales bacterium]